MAGMPDPRTAYTDLPEASSGPAVSRVERALLVELFRELGPATPTLCEGWTTHHLAAHLKIREGNPSDQVRNVIRGDTAVESAAATTDYASLVARVASGPPLLSPFRLPKLEPMLNSLEYFVHHEDVRRAQPGWKPRDLPPWAQDQLWRGALGFCKLSLRKVPMGVRLERTDTGETADVRPGNDPVVLRGLPAEIVLYLFGRRSVANVELTGPSEPLAAFTARTFSA
jgi:uncharacterized protein (TIGR03085 family)